MTRRATLLALSICSLASPALAQDDDEGRLVRFLEDSLSNGQAQQIDLQGFRGALSSEASLDRLTISDEEGVWITIEGVVLNWNRAAILRGAIDITQLTAERVTLTRLPQSEPDPVSPEATPFALPELPVSIEIEAVAIASIEIGEAVLGQPVTAELETAITLSGGDGDAQLNLVRLDTPGGQVTLDASYSNADGSAVVDLSVEEEAGGLAASLLNLPGAPSVDLTLVGQGPISAFEAEFQLSTDGMPRLAGQYIGAQDEAGSQSFEVRVDGDLTPLLQGDALTFVGDDTSLQARATRASDGAIRLETLALRSGVLALEGSGEIDADQQPVRFDLEGRLSADTNAPIALPGAGDAQIAGARFSTSYDRALGDEVRVRAELFEVTSDAVNAESVLLGVDGRLLTVDGAVTGYRGPLVVQANGLSHQDRDIAQALGERLTLATQVSWDADGDLVIDDLVLRSQGVEAGGQITLSPGEERLDLAAELDAGVERLSIFSGLAGRQLSGSANATVSLSANLIDQSFDLLLAAEGQDLRTSDVPDALSAGSTQLDGRIIRDAQGILLESFEINGTQVGLLADGRLASDSAALNLDASIRDLAAADPRLQGPLEVNGRVDRTSADAPYTLSDLLITSNYGDISGTASVLPEDGLVALTAEISSTLPDATRFRELAGLPLAGSLDLDLEASGSWPAGVDVQLSGMLDDLEVSPALPTALFRGETDIRADVTLGENTVTVRDLAVDGTQLDLSGSGEVNSDQSRLALALNLANAAIFTSALPGPVALEAQGARNGQGPWDVTATGDGPGGLNVSVDGNYGTAADLTITGSAPLALANQFIAPRNIAGTLGLDLALRGPPALGSLSGTLRTSDARLSAPSFNVALEQISASIGLAQSTANITASAGLSTGGQLNVDGRVNLHNTALPADISIALQNARIVDPTLYEAIIENAALTLSGALAGNSILSGQVNLGDVEVRVPESGLGGSSAIPDIRHVGESAAERQTRSFAGLLGRAEASGGSSAIGLDVGVNAPGRIFIRGRGLDAELGGVLRVTGTTANPVPAGQFELIRGRLSILGQRLELTRGSATLVGGDPFVDLLAETSTPDYQIFIAVRGLASAPEITFSSAPELPEDEVLAQLFFGRSVETLSPLQALQLADAVAGLAGGGSSAFTRLREGLGLDNLDIQSDEEGNAAVRAGRYLSENIYTDIIIDDDGAGVSLNIDLTPSITARGEVGADGESSLGIFFEQDY